MKLIPPMSQVTPDTKEDQLYETWLLLEYCDKGSLQSAVDRGWFHTDTHGHVNSQAKPNMQAIRSATHTAACILPGLV